MKRLLTPRLLLAGSAAMLLAVPALAAGPSISITGPAGGAKVSGDTIPVSVTVNDFNLECRDVGKPAKAGQGHIHAMIDGMTMAHMSNLYCDQSFEISGTGLKKGSHRIAVTLASDDHVDISKPAMVAFDYEPAQVKPLPAPVVSKRPRVAIVSPEKGATVPRTFDLAVKVNDFNLSCALEGKPNVAGYGHIHVFALEKGVTDVKPAMPMSHEGRAMGGSMKGGSMKGEMKGHEMAGHEMMPMMSMVGMLSMPCTQRIPIDLSSWKAGTVRLMVMLANDDHEPTKGAQPAVVDVTLQ